MCKITKLATVISIKVLFYLSMNFMQGSDTYINKINRKLILIIIVLLISSIHLV